MGRDDAATDSRREGNQTMTQNGCQATTTKPRPTTKSPASTAHRKSYPLPVAPDGGWGWVVCGCSFICMVILDGMMFSFGVLLLELLDFFKVGKGRTAMVGSALMGTSLLAGPLVSAMVNAWGVRTVTMTGGLVATLAFATSTLSPSITCLTVLYGFLGGVGVSMVYLPSILAVGFYFEKRRALANGITQSGSGIGTFLYSPFTEYLQLEFGWQGAVLILSGIVLHCIVCGALYRPISTRGPVTSARKEKSSAITGENGGKVTQQEEECLLGNETNVHAHRRNKQSLYLDEYISNSCDVISAASPRPVLVNKQLARLQQCRNTQRLHASSGGLCAGEIDHGLTLAGSVPSVKVVSASPVTNRRDTSVTTNMFPGQTDSAMKLSVSCEVIGTTDSHQDSSVTANGSDYKTRREQSLVLKPQYRKDLFYTGSLQRIPEYRTEKSVSLYSLPQDDGTVLTHHGNGVVPAETASIASSCSISAKTRCKSSRCNNCCTDMSTMLRQMMGVTLLRNPVFLLVMFSMVLWTTHSTILSFLADYSVMQGVGKDRAALLLSIIGATNTAARVAAGWALDRDGADCLWLNMAALFLGGVTCVVIPFTSSYILLGLEAGVFGLCMGTWTSLRPIILVDLLGLDNLTNSFGLVAMFQGVAFLAGPPIAGTLYDQTDSYLVPFLLAGAAFTLSGLLCLPLRRIARCAGGNDVTKSQMEMSLDVKPELGGKNLAPPSETANGVSAVVDRDEKLNGTPADTLIGVPGNSTTLHEHLP